MKFVPCIYCGIKGVFEDDEKSEDWACIICDEEFNQGDKEI